MKDAIGHYSECIQQPNRQSNTHLEFPDVFLTFLWLINSSSDDQCHIFKVMFIIIKLYFIFIIIFKKWITTKKKHSLFLHLIQWATPTIYIRSLYTATTRMSPASDKLWRLLAMFYTIYNVQRISLHQHLQDGA